MACSGSIQDKENLFQKKVHLKAAEWLYSNKIIYNVFGIVGLFFLTTTTCNRSFLAQRFLIDHFSTKAMPSLSLRGVAMEWEDDADIRERLRKTKSVIAKEPWEVEVKITVAHAEQNYMALKPLVRRLLNKKEEVGMHSIPKLIAELLDTSKHRSFLCYFSFPIKDVLLGYMVFGIFWDLLGDCFRYSSILNKPFGMIPSYAKAQAGL